MSCLLDIISYLRLCFGYYSYYFVWTITNFIQDTFCSKRTSFDDSCRILNIVYRCKFEIADESSPQDFVAIHEKYASPQYLLNENISLYCLTKDSAYFVETEEQHNVLKSECCPFQYIGQFKNAVNLIELSLPSLYRLSDRLGDPIVNVCLLLNTGRCGSTVIAKALENIPGTLLHAEPDCLTNLASIWKSKTVTQSEYERILLAAIRYLCKPRRGIERICIKTRSIATCHITAVDKHFPKCKIIFIYRNSLQTIASFLSVPWISETIKSIKLSLIDSDTVAYYLPWFRRRECTPIVAAADDRNFVEQEAYAWSSYITLVRDFKKHGGKVVTVRYEDMTAAKVNTLEMLFQELNIDISFIEDALKAFEHDSQAGTILSRENLRRREIKDMDRAKANKIFAKYGLPNLGDDCIL